MKTVVETFLVEETAALIYDNDQLQKWGDMVTQLGLTGQQDIVKEDKSPIPFLWMNKSLINMFETLCPRKVKVEEYNKMPIPVEILDLISLSKREGYFFLMEIWYDDNTPDPVCIGYHNHKVGGSEWDRKYYAEKYLLGKWSDVRASFSELFERAKKRFIAEKENGYRRQIRDGQRGLEDIGDEADRHFGIGNKSIGDDLPF